MGEEGVNQCKYAYECGGNDNNEGITFFPYLFCIPFYAQLMVIAITCPMLLLLLITFFRVLGSTAEDYLSPGLEMLSCKLGLPPRFAGVSLLALGNGAPDVSSSSNAIKSNPDTGYLLSLGALTGAGMFIGCIVSGMVIVVSDGLPCRGALVRDVIMYGFSLFIVYYQLQRGYIDMYSIRLFIGIYVSFVLIVLIADLYHRKVVIPRKKSISLHNNNNNHIIHNNNSNTEPLY